MTKRRIARRSDLTVRIERDDQGVIFSGIFDMATYGNPPERGRNWFCLDRVKGQGMREECVRTRAKACAELLGLPLVEDAAWRCQAVMAKRNCGCPRCVAERTKQATRRARHGDQRAG